jgi:hypothetical protein
MERYLKKQLYLLSLTISIQQSPSWEDDSRSANQKITPSEDSLPCSLVHILSQMNLAHILLS